MSGLNINNKKHRVIYLNNTTTAKLPVRRIKLLVEMLVTKIKQERKELSVTFCTDSQIKKINKTFRAEDKATDVLSFPMEDREILGDIFISIPAVKRQAKLYGNSFEAELFYLVVHGLCHLQGNDHGTSAEIKIMQKAEQLLINVLAKYKLKICGRI